MTDKKSFLNDFRELLVTHCGGCAIQEAKDGTEWPCGTCVTALFGSVLDVNSKEYDEHNEDVDRVNEIWRAILQMRDALPDDNERASA
jgi:hypothetical protein